MYLRRDTLVTVTEACPLYAGRHGRIEQIQLDEETFEPVIFVSLWTGSEFALLPFFKGEIARRPKLTRAMIEQHLLTELALKEAA